MAKNRLSRDQKRKQKLAARAQRSPQTESLAYSGRKYKSRQLLPVWINTETGIYEAFQLTQRALTDQTVVSALEQLIVQMREGTMAPFDEAGSDWHNGGDEESLVIWRIRQNWLRLSEKDRQPSRADLVGVVRSILSSIDATKTAGPWSQGYLRHMERFLNQVGVRVVAHDPGSEEYLEQREEARSLGSF